MIRYAIFTTPRTGSNLLCELLASTGVAGITSVDHAHFFIGYGEGLKADGVWPDRMHQYFEANTQGKVVGCKLSFDYLDHISQFIPFGEVDTLLRMFSHFIYLYREDRIAQAISWYVARRSTIWTSEAKRDPKKNAHPVEYDFDRIAYFLAMIKGEQSRVASFFESHRIEPLKMCYEENIKDHKWAVRQVLDHIHVENGLEGWDYTPTLQKQHDIRKQKFKTQFLRDRSY